MTNIIQHQSSAMIVRPTEAGRALRRVDEHGLARALGWFSLGLGLTELFMPRRLGRAIGVGERTLLLPALGLREIASGVGILAARNPATAVRSRVMGDIMDLGLLGAALVTPNARRSNVLMAGAAVASVTALDVFCSSLLSKRDPSHIGEDASERRQVEISRSVTLRTPVEELYQFWRTPENLPRVLDHIQSVAPRDDLHSHWIAKLPTGASLEWDAMLSVDVPNQRLGWRSLDGTGFANETAVEFKPLAASRETVVTVSVLLKPKGALTGALTKLMQGLTAQQLQRDLRRFKQLMETGEIATTEGQPAGQRSSISRHLP